MPSIALEEDEDGPLSEVARVHLETARRRAAEFADDAPATTD